MDQSQAVRSAPQAAAGFRDAEDRFIRCLNKHGYDITGRSEVIPFHQRALTAMVTTGAGRRVAMPALGDAA